MVQKVLLIFFIGGLIGLIPCGAVEPPTAEALTDVTLTLKSRGPSSDLTAQGLATWFGEGKVEPVSFSVSAKEPAVLKLRPGRWELRAEAPGYWGSPSPLELREAPASLRLDLWPAGVIEGGFIQESGITPPAELALFLRSSPGGEKEADLPPEAKVTCPVEKGTWRCIVPAGSLDLRFQAAGFVPRYLWGIHVSPGATVRPGRLELRQGSSVLGWVVTADRTPLKAGTKVVLRPRVAGRVQDSSDRQRLSSLQFEAVINSKGFFQIDGMPAGAYVAEVRHEGFAPAIASVRVVQGEVTEIANPPLLLDFPKVVEVFVDPPVGPGDQPWSLKLQRLDRDSSVVSTVAEGGAGTEGHWKKEGISPGHYLLRVYHQGNAWWMDEVRVEDASELIQVKLETVQVRGTVHLGKKPLAATVRFGGRWGAVRIEARSDERGRFETLLPQSGAWMINVSSDTPRVEREFPKVLIEPKPQSDVAEVDLKLPDTWLRGVVRREGGEPAAKAIVTAMSQGEVWEGPVQVYTDEEGRFEMRGLRPGRLLLEADAGPDAIADPVVVDLEEEGENLPVVLLARPQLKISGRVASAMGPVAGARVKAAPAGLPYVTVGTVTSSAEGRFELKLPPKTRELMLSVSAPGFAFRMLRVPVPEDRNLVLGLDSSAGTLILEREGILDLTDPNGRMLYLLRGGAVEPLPTLLSWAVLSGAVPQEEKRSVIPALEPGDYQVCWATPAERSGLDYGIAPNERCAKGSLQANGELTLKIPE